MQAVADNLVGVCSRVDVLNQWLDVLRRLSAHAGRGGQPVRDKLCLLVKWL